MTTITDPLVQDPATAARGRWLMLIVLLAGQFMALLDVTVVNVAMPTIGRTLRASGAELQLIVAGYTVSYAMMLITGARLGDLYGRRRVFLVGIEDTVRPESEADAGVLRVPLHDLAQGRIDLGQAVERRAASRASFGIIRVKVLHPVRGHPGFTRTGPGTSGQVRLRQIR